MYIPVENTNSFVYAGPFMGGTVISSNNIVQDTWNADTKLDKVTTSGGRRVYAISGSGAQDIYTLRPDITASPNYQIVVRNSGGQVIVPATPTNDTNATSKKYVDDKAVIYEHNIHIIGQHPTGDSFDIYEKHYNHSSTQETSLNTGGTTTLTGTANISSEVCIVIDGLIDTDNSNISITYVRDGNVETTVFDSASVAVTDRVRQIL